jgi:hypothetical protein
MAFNILKNKYVLYFLLFISMTNVLGYLALHDYESLTLMVSIGMLSYYFSKNMTVILSTAILGAALLRVPARKEWPWREKEGMENKEDEEDEEEDKEEKEGLKLLETLENKEGNSIIQKAKNVVEAEKETEKETFKSTEGLEKRKHKVEEQYNNLTKLTNSGGTSNHVLLEEQMKNLGPLMKSAENMMAMMEGSGMLGMMEKMTPLLEKITQT